MDRPERTPVVRDMLQHVEQRDQVVEPPGNIERSGSAASTTAGRGSLASSRAIGSARSSLPRPKRDRTAKVVAGAGPSSRTCGHCGPNDPFDYDRREFAGGR